MAGSPNIIMCFDWQTCITHAPHRYGQMEAQPYLCMFIMQTNQTQGRKKWNMTDILMLKVLVKKYCYSIYI